MTLARVGHLFGFVENSIHPVKSNNVGAKQFNRVNGSIVHTIGIARKSKNRNYSPCEIAKHLFHRVNLTYHICRCNQLKIVVSKG